ncbi:hypothetical protein DM01DRAFT_1382296 [Hesseltinella vesiculosa]|uniref:Protein YOP1 n=1 Tax=Hesseltinella vesiculosa TaxID=101127 RepID=A0A1X2GLQ9_9FUNG|nr:hypothetical protein DM01DRAFT_1382296 [Hesseltinella vesiculosa]
MIVAVMYVLMKLMFLQLYPAYMCFKALKLNDAKQYSHLVIYWLVTTTYLVVEYVADIFVFWLPFYYEIKLLLILWLIFPQTNGTKLLYDQYLEPFLKKNEQQIDQAVIETQHRIKVHMTAYSKRLVQLIRSSISDSLFKPKEEEPVMAAKAVDPIADNSWSPIGLFATLMNATSGMHQLAQQATTKITADTSADATSSSPSLSDPRLDRTESYDSLASLVNNNPSPTSTPNPSATWSGYFSSFLWKQPAAEKSTKQD